MDIPNNISTEVKLTQSRKGRKYKKLSDTDKAYAINEILNGKSITSIAQALDVSQLCIAKLKGLGNSKKAIAARSELSDLSLRVARRAMTQALHVSLNDTSPHSLVGMAREAAYTSTMLTGEQAAQLNRQPLRIIIAGKEQTVIIDSSKQKNEKTEPN